MVLVALLGSACTSPSGDATSPTSPATATSSSVAPTDAAPSDSEATDSARTADVVEVPRDGACYRLGFAALPRASNDSTPVPCRGDHNAQTIHVGTLDTVVGGRPVAVDSKAVRAQVSTTCARRLARTLGGSWSTRALSRFQVVWFTPAPAEYDAGADWFRCDVIAFAGHERLAPLPVPRRLDGVLDDRAGLDEFGLCGTAAPGAPAFERVICSLRHSWRAIATIPISGRRAYPGTARGRAAGDDVCRDRVRELSGSSLRFRYGWEWPTRDQWARGQRHGFCWAPSSR